MEPGARRRALGILQAVRRGEPFEAALQTLPPISESDRRLAHEIAAGVLRERRALDLVIQAALTHPDRRMPPDVRDTLRIGVYQLRRLDRVPEYAAVQTTVDLAKAACGPRFAPFVNAVMRRLSAEAPAEAEPATLAERYSHPDWLVARWTARYGEEGTEALLRHNNTRPRLVVQPLGLTERELSARLDAAGIAHGEAPAGRGIEVRTAAVTDLPGYEDGAFVVQDPAQRLLLEFAAIDPPTTVWDVCAAPGGKAASLARRHRVLASDRSRNRIERLRGTLRRVAPGTPVFAADGRHPPLRAGTVPCVLVDAPCSATGTIARHPDARWRLSPRRIREAAARQRQILTGTAETVQPGGLLVYLTCSLEPEENDLQIDRFLDDHRQYRREGPDCHVFPPDHGTDGGYGARLRRIA